MLLFYNSIIYMKINPNRRKLVIDLNNKDFKTILKHKNQQQLQKQINLVQDCLNIKTIISQQTKGRNGIHLMKITFKERKQLHQCKTLSHFSQKKYTHSKIIKQRNKNQMKIRPIVNKSKGINIQKQINKFIESLKFNQHVSFFNKIFAISQSCLFKVFTECLQNINNDTKQQKSLQTNIQGIRDKSKTVNLQDLHSQAKFDPPKSANKLVKIRNTFLFPVIKANSRKQKNKKLALQSQVVKFSIHQLEVKQGNQQKKMMSYIQRKYLSIREELLNNLKYFKLEIKDKKKVLKQMAENCVQQKQLKNVHGKKQNALGPKIQQKRKLLKNIEDEANSLAYYFVRKPMQAIEEEMVSLKQKQKQLFAFLLTLQQSTFYCISNQIEACIRSSLENLKSSMLLISRQCPQSAIDFKMNRQQFQEFKAKIFSTFQYTIEQLSALVKQKNDKINQFLNYMDGYSVYSVAKMERMEEYNKKMCIFQIKDHQFFKEILKVQTNIRNDKRKTTKLAMKNSQDSNI